MGKARVAALQGIDMIAKSAKVGTSHLLGIGLLALSLSACDGGSAQSGQGAVADAASVGQGGAGGAGGVGGAGGAEPPTSIFDAGPRPPVMPATDPGHGLPEPEDRAVEVGEGEPTELAHPEVPPPPAEPAGRPRRRMNLDQLNASIRQVTGGVGWTEQRGATQIDLFEELASTLGKPDYLQVTHEDLEPSALFQKFLDDAARSVCAATVAADLARPQAERALMRYIEPDADPASARAATTANLQYVLRRFHGRNLRLDDVNLDAWRWQLEATVFSQVSPAEAWGAICVALITHPHFYTY